MAIISINKLKLSTIIGTKKEERIKPQQIIFDISFNCNSEKAGKTDDLKYAVDYNALSKRIINKLSKTKFFLLEKLAQETLDIVLEDKLIKEAKVTIYKPKALANADSVSITLTRKQK